ncbi:MAG: TIGR01212 family radical SAM protein [Peptostreptococcaceae bacterium]|nr:TIGR01212 family radical SAM protein [Peptostreptococcaceae bacterium]
MLYKEYSDYLQKKYKKKVYKIPINLPTTCPNIDGEVSYNGCTFCAEVGTGFECLSSDLSVGEQLDKNIKYIGEKYNASKFIAYFQNYTNTYMPFEQFKDYIKEALRDDVVGISISTRPDSINDKHLEYLSMIKEMYQTDISIELGLQSANYKTLSKINRGHSLAEFIDAVNRIRKYDFEIVVHVILNLPYDDMDDVIETAKILSALNIDSVKIHSLYIAKNTEMAAQYLRGELDLKTAEDYVEKVATFLSYLKENIVIQRLAARAPEEETLFCNYGMSWWKLKEMIEEYMKNNHIIQGMNCDYLNGKAVRKFF